jgi:hypothetical protein
MVVLPVNLWAEVFSFAFYFGEEDDGQLSGEFMLLCRSITEALDDRFLHLVDSNKRLETSAGILPAIQPLWLQKRVVVALDRAPLDQKRIIKTIGSDFLHLDMYSDLVQFNFSPFWETLSGLPALRTIQKGFGEDIPTDCVDLNRCPSLTKIGDEFLTNSTASKVLLPASLQALGDRAMSLTRIVFMDLSTTAITSVGKSFLCDSPLRQIRFPPTLTKIGSGFLMRTQIESLDLSHTQVKEIPREFLLRCRTLTEIRFPATLQLISHSFLVECGVKVVDLSHTVVESIQNNFLQLTPVQEVRFPSTLLFIGEVFCCKTALPILDLSATAVKSLCSLFADGSPLRALKLPPTLASIGEEFCQRCESLEEPLDLSSTQVRHISDYFLHCATSPKLAVSFPAALTEVDDDFLSESSIRSVDLSQTSLTSVGKNFLSKNRFLESLLLPPTLRNVDREFLAQAATIAKVDLSHTQLEVWENAFLSFALSLTELIPSPKTKRINTNALGMTKLSSLDFRPTALTVLEDRILIDSSIQHLWFPATLTRIGNACLVRTQLKQLDLSNTSLEKIWNEFLLETPIEEISFPPTLKAIGTHFLWGCPAIRIVDLTSTQLETVGEQFLWKSEAVVEIRFPETVRRVGQYCNHKEKISCPTLRMIRFEADTVVMPPPRNASG